MKGLVRCSCTMQRYNLNSAHLLLLKHICSSTLVQAVAADHREDTRAEDEAAMEAGVEQAEVGGTVAIRSLWLIVSEGVTRRSRAVVMCTPVSVRGKLTTKEQRK